MKTNLIVLILILFTGPCLALASNGHGTGSPKAASYVSLAITTEGTPVFNPGDPMIQKIRTTTEMQGKFAVKAYSNENANYYLTDFTKLDNSFAKAWFMKLASQSKVIVPAETSLNNIRVWFSAPKNTSETDAIAELNDLLTRTLYADRNVTEQAKSDFLSNNK
jgi:hypothetical protein